MFAVSDNTGSREISSLIAFGIDQAANGSGLFNCRVFAFRTWLVLKIRLFFFIGLISLGLRLIVFFTFFLERFVIGLDGR